MKKNDLVFNYETVSILDVDLTINTEYKDPFPEVIFYFDDKEKILLSLSKTKDVESEFDTLLQLFKIFDCKKLSEFKNRRVDKITYKKDNWNDAIFVGIGLISKDMFIDLHGNISSEEDAKKKIIEIMNY